MKSKSPLAVKAATGAKFLASKGHRIPSSLIAEMLARLEGKSSYAAYLAGLKPQAATECAAHLPDQTTRSIRIFEVAKGSWLIIPPEFVEIYDTNSAFELMHKFNAPSFRSEMEMLNYFLAFELDEQAEAKITRGWADLSTIDKAVKLPAPMAPAANITYWKAAARSTRYRVMELAISDESYQRIISDQRSLIRNCAIELVAQVREAKKGDSAPATPEALRAEVAKMCSGEYPDIPEFWNQVNSL